ncbi:MAG: methylmalonyl Co-A mutase-associated GTPase MeaB [Alphaproteobacteria bacterium]|nr:methylmalonyl Co-A mutase-associated GTPase MeaB [Alphaproteobacteria bacterium]
MAAALGAIEGSPDDPAVIGLLDRAWRAPRAHVIGLTGPPGVGKSTLTGALIRAWRGSGRSVGVIAVDPSSKRSGGALLGDRTRLATDPEDQGIFVRSMAARDRLGGLAGISFAAMVLMRAVYDVVLVETVGVGQSETDVITVADSVVFCIQPGSGDSLQFMKAGIMEVPHVIVVTKADMGQPAVRARADVRGALSLNSAGDGWDVPVLLASASSGAGLEEVVETLDRRRAWLGEGRRLEDARAEQDRHWLAESLRDRFGREGLAALGAALAEHADGASPFAREAALAATLRARLG